MSYSKKLHLKKAIKHAFLTGIAMDIVGFSLSGHTLDERLKYISSDKTSFPQHKQLPHYFNNKGSFNSNFTMFLLDCLTDFCPVELDDLFEFQAYLKKKLKTYNSNFNREHTFIAYDPTHGYASDKLLIHSKKDRGITIPIAVVCGLYTAQSEQDLLFLFTLFDTFTEALDIQDANMSILAFIIYRLCATGYFGYHLLDEIINHSLLSESFEEFFLTLVENNIDVNFLQQPFNNELVKDCCYSEKILAEVMFYMCRVDAAYRKDGFKSLPREQLVEVFTTQDYPADISYLFGTFCTISEQLHPLIPKTLREENPYSEKVSEFLEYV